MTTFILVKKFGNFTKVFNSTIRFCQNFWLKPKIFDRNRGKFRQPCLDIFTKSLLLCFQKFWFSSKSFGNS